MRIKESCSPKCGYFFIELLPNFVGTYPIFCISEERKKFMGYLPRAEKGIRGDEDLAELIECMDPINKSL